MRPSDRIKDNGLFAVKFNWHVGEAYDLGVKESSTKHCSTKRRSLINGMK